MIHIIEPVDPSLILGVDDFEACLVESERRGKWETWKSGYFETYRGAFQPMLDVVYQHDVDGLRPYVEAMDWAAALANARAFVDADGVQKVRDAIRHAMTLLPSDQPFPVYLLVGFGHANGMALPAKEPYLYLGLERAKCLESLEGLVAHEYNHLYRVQRFYRDIDDSSYTVNQLTVGEFTLSEGLATVFPLVLLGQPLTPHRIAECSPALGDPAEAVAKETEMQADVLAHWDCPADRAMLERFYSNGVSYYVGARMIADLVDAGYDICALTRTRTEKLGELVMN